MTPKEKKREKIIIYKNVLIVSLSFLLLFVAFESMSKLQSSINKVTYMITFIGSDYHSCNFAINLRPCQFYHITFFFKVFSRLFYPI